jgi:hypothetical protein
MTSTQIRINLPSQYEIPYNISEFSLEENILLINAGINAVLFFRNKQVLPTLTSNINIIEELKSELELKNKEILINQENYEKSLEKLQELFFQKIDPENINTVDLDGISKQTQQLNYFMNQITLKESECDTYYHSKSTSNNADISIQEKQIQTVMLSAFQKIPEFKIMDNDLSNLRGEFELNFKHFSVFVDTNHDLQSITLKSKDKLKKDLLNRQSCFFGWIISTNNRIEQSNKSPFIFEWISGNKCMCYLNYDLFNPNSIELLRLMYFTCETVFNIINVDSTDITELHKLKENEKRIHQIVQNMIKNTYERDEIILNLKHNFQVQDEMTRQILNKETNDMVDKSFSRVIEWWNFNIVNEEGKTMRSSNIWTMFKRDNPDLVGEIQANEFKDILYSFLSEERIIKPRNKFGALEIKNVRWKIDRNLECNEH